MPVPTGLSKFSWGAPDEAALHPGPIVGRRPSDGMPVLGNGYPAPDMIGDQADDLPMTMQFAARMFRMWVEKEAAAYVTIMDHVLGGQMHVIARREILAEEPETGQPGQHLKIWLEWGQAYVQAAAPRERVGPGGYR